MREAVWKIFSTLQRHFVVNTRVKYIFIDFIAKSGAIWRKTTRFSFIKTTYLLPDFTRPTTSWKVNCAAWHYVR